MKEYKGIVQSSTEPKIGFVWLKDSKLFYFSGNGWTQINEGVTLEEVITLLDRKLDTGTFNDFRRLNDQKIGKVDSRVTQVSNSLETEKGKINTLENSNTKLNDTITNIESEIVKLKKDISALQEQINNPKE